MERIYDSNDIRVGCLKHNDTVYDRYHRVVGYIDAPVLYDANYRRIGYVKMEPSINVTAIQRVISMVGISMI